MLKDTSGASLITLYTRKVCRQSSTWKKTWQDGMKP